MGSRLPFALLAYLSAFGASSAMNLRPRLTIGDQFTLYAWGHNISALPVFYADGEYANIMTGNLKIQRQCSRSELTTAFW